MNRSEKVSVVMSVYNAEKTIENSINSILNQSKCVSLVIQWYRNIFSKVFEMDKVLTC